MAQQRKAKGGRIRLSGPIAGLVVAVFSALTFGVAQSQIAVDAVPWVEAVIETARGIVLPSPVHPTRPANMPTAPRPVFTPGDTPPRLPQPPPDIVPPTIPEALETVPMTPYGPLPTRVRRTGSADAAQMCAAGCQESIDAAIARCGGYASEAILAERVEFDPACRERQRAQYESCMANCGFDRLPRSIPGRRIDPDKPNIFHQDVAP